MQRTARILAVMLFILPTFLQAQNTTINVGKDIELIKLTDHAWVHVTYSVIQPFGRSASNGLIYACNGKAFLFDTPVTDSLTSVLLDYLQDSMRIQVVGVIANHWHVDCAGGLGEVSRRGITSYGNNQTIEILKEKGLPAPDKGFTDSATFYLENIPIVCKYYGAAHTVDNIVCYIPQENILFGGCMIKTLGAQSMGNIADADLKQWPVTVTKVLNAFPDARFVIPGHGPYGGTELLRHTIELCEKNQ